MASRPSSRLIIVSLVICGLIAGFICALPEVARRIAVSRLQTIFTVPVTIDNVDVNLFTGRATVESLFIGKRDQRPILTLPAATIEFSRANLLLGGINLQTIVLQNPRLLLERLTPENHNVLAALRTPRKSKDNKTAGVGFTIDLIEVRDGEIIFTDYVQDPDYQVTFSSFQLAAGPISALPEARATPTNFTVGLNVAGGTVKLAGSTTPLPDALDAQMTAEIANVKLQAFQAYLPYGGKINLEKTLLNGEARYALSYRQGKITQHSLDGRLKAGNIALLAAPKSEPIMEVVGLSAQDIHIDLLRSNAQIGALAIDAPYLLVRRDSSGFNLRQLLPESESQNPEQDNRNGIRMPLVVKNAELESGAVEFVDQTVKPTGKTLLQDVRIAASNMAVLPTFAAEQISAKARAEKGSVEVTGAVHDAPLRGNFSVVGRRLPFGPYSGYLNRLFRAARSSGEYIDGELKLAFAPEAGGAIVTSIGGRLEGYDMRLEFPDKPEPFLVTERLRVNVNTIRLGSEPRVDIDRIAFSGANLRVVRNEDNTIDIARLWASEEKHEKKGPGTILAIHSIAVEKSSIEILDRSVSPNYRTTVSRLNGKLSGLLPNAKRAELNGQGILSDSANLALSGWFTPFAEKPYLQLHGTIGSHALPPLNPYATEYVSHRIREGQITMDVNYALKGNEIQASAQILLRDVRVGEQTGDEFRSRVGMPLPLAIALLQDIQGVVRLQMAMSGDAGPKLNVASLIWGAVRNAIIRAITAPFRLVGRILTSGDRIGRVQIQPIFFEPGTREITTQSAKQLADLTELLKEKPRLELRLNGGASQRERETIKKEKFWQKVRTVEGSDYEESLIRLYHGLGGITKPRAPLAPEVEESLERFVLQRMEVTEQELQALSRDRAEIVKNELQKRGVDPGRLIVGGEAASAADEAAVEIELTS
jgi:hypothetical protein